MEQEVKSCKKGSLARRRNGLGVGEIEGRKKEQGSGFWIIYIWLVRERFTCNENISVGGFSVVFWFLRLEIWPVERARTAATPHRPKESEESAP